MELQNSTILIVDDNPLGREALGDVLEPEGYIVAFAADGPEALKIASEIYPDVVLLDVMMPGMDGYEVCRRLRTDPKLAEMPVLMVTALDDRRSRLRGIEAGADDFISKPFDRIEMRARMRTITRLNRYRKLREEHIRLEQAYDELQQTHEGTLSGWVRALDLRDKETEGHSERVVELTSRLAKTAGIEGEDLIHLRRGALLHDIGKLGVPDAILLKPGSLTSEEWIIMQQHPLHAYEWLSAIPYLRMTIDIPYCHHEKWNGTGYPRGLKGEEIPLSARLFALVDVWDALRSDRPYREAWSREKTLDHIQKDRGKHFDPDATELFLEMMDRSKG
jgi:putative two-component system response regulator